MADKSFRKTLIWLKDSMPEPSAVRSPTGPAAQSSRQSTTSSDAPEAVMAELAPQSQDRSRHDNAVAAVPVPPDDPGKGDSPVAMQTGAKRPLYRKRWFLYGSGCLLIVLVGPVVLSMLAFSLAAMGIVPQASRVLETAGETLWMICIALTCVTFGYRLLGRHQIHRGQPDCRTSRVYSAMKIAVPVTFILAIVCINFALLIPAFLAARAAATADSSQPTQFISRDGRYLIETPSGWQESSQLLENDALICISHFGADLHMSVNAVNRSDFVEPNLQGYAANCAAQLSQSLENSETSPWNVISVNDTPALQCEVHGEIGNVRAAYLLTCVDVTDHFCLVLAWTTRSLLEENRPVLDGITRTFRRVEN